MKQDDLHLFSDQARPLYMTYLRRAHDSERQLLEALPALAANLSVVDAREQVLLSWTQIPGQLARLEHLFVELSEPPTGQVCEPIRELVVLAEMIGEEYSPGPLRDLLLLALAKELKKNEIVNYTLAITLADALGYTRHSLIHLNLKQSKVNADRHLLSSMERIELTTRRS